MNVMMILPATVSLRKSLLMAMIMGFFLPTLFAQTSVSEYKTNGKPLGRILAGGSVVGNKLQGVNLTSYVAPLMHFRLDYKWTIGGGVMIRNTSFWGSTVLSNEKVAVSLPQNTMQSLFFLQGLYRVNERVALSALVFQSMDLGGTFENKMQTDQFNSSFKGGVFDVNYKITEHSFINIGFNYSHGDGNPFMHRSLIGSSRFNNGSGGIFAW